jgi:hypothetical protein
LKRKKKYMNQHQEQVLANNILEFLIDPTKFPVKQRVYFRPEEILRNESYEGARAEAQKTYKDQRKNSDFYPSKNRPSREAFIMDSKMDRKTVIASMDVLAQHFYDENDPVATDLRTMAKCVAELSDAEYDSRLASSVEAKGKAETVPCPVCQTKILKQTGYCLKCKKKTLGGGGAEKEKEATVDLWSKEAADAVQQALVSDVVGTDDDAPPAEEAPAEKAPVEEKKEEKESSKEKDSFLVTNPGESGQRMEKPSLRPGTGKIKSIYEELSNKTRQDIMSKPELKALKEVFGPFMAKSAEAAPEAPAAPAPETKEPMPKKEEEKKAAKKEEVVPPAPEKKEEMVPPVPEKKATEPKKIVDTNILAYDGIEMEAGMVEAGELSAEEQTRLNQLFQ